MFPKEIRNESYYNHSLRRCIACWIHLLTWLPVQDCIGRGRGYQRTRFAFHSHSAAFASLFGARPCESSLFASMNVQIDVKLLDVRKDDKLWDVLCDTKLLNNCSVIKPLPLHCYRRLVEALADRFPCSEQIFVRIGLCRIRPAQELPLEARRNWPPIVCLR